MRKILFIVLSGLMVHMSYGQGGVVSAPVLEAQAATGNTLLASVLTGIELSNDAIDVIEDIKKSAGFMADLKATADLIVVMESYACLANDFVGDLTEADGLFGPQASCLFDFRHTSSLMRIQFAADLLNHIMMSGFVMEPGDRVTAIGQVITQYEETMKEISQQKYRVRKLIRKYEREQEEKKSEDWLWEMTYSGSNKSFF